MKIDELPRHDHLLCEVSRGVATLWISRPERRNAFTGSMYRTLSELIVATDRVPEIRCLVLRGTGGTFTSGSDIEHLLNLSIAEREEHFQLVADLLTAPARIGKPVIAAVQGFALGGGTGLAAACDLAIADQSACFGLPEVAVGLWPCTLLPALARAIGGRKAYEMALLGHRLRSEQALELGLVNRVAPTEGFEREVEEISARVAAWSPAAIQMGKRAFQRSTDSEFHSATRLMGQVMALNSATDDARNGIAAFLKGQRPEWAGR